MSKVERVRFGMIGAGNIGNVHMRVLSQLPDEAEVVGVTDAYLPLAEQRAEEHGVKLYQSKEELLADEAIDAVVIGVPNKFHAPIAIEALEAGKHVVLEKPMALNLESAKEIVRATEKSGKKLMVPHQMRWELLNAEIKTQIEKGNLGKVYQVKAGWMRRKGIPGWGTWFTRMEESGGGPLIDIGVHLLDVSLYLMGNPKPVSVFGSTFAEFGPKKKGIGTWGTPNWDGFYDVEDLASALIKMEDGSVLSLDVSWAVHGEIENNAPYIHLMGSEGGAYAKGSAGKLFLEQFDRAIDVELDMPDSGDQARKRMFAHFIDCVINDRMPISNAMTGYTNNLILDAIYRSSETGREVILDWDI